MSGWEKRERALKLALTYVRKARDILWSGPLGRREPIEVLGIQYQWLLEEMVDVACEIAKLLPDDYFVSEEITDYFGLLKAVGVEAGGKFNASDAVYESAKKLVAVLEQRRESEKTLRIIRALESNEGRTPEEAELHLAHARRLREKLVAERKVS